MAKSSGYKPKCANNSAKRASTSPNRTTKLLGYKPLLPDCKPLLLGYKPLLPDCKPLKQSIQPCSNKSLTDYRRNHNLASTATSTATGKNFYPQQPTPI